MFTDGVTYKGKVKVELNGKLVFEKDNLVVTAGKNLAASRLMSNSPNFITHMGLGNGTAAPAVGQTALVTPLTPRVATTNSVAANVATFVGQFLGGVATGVINEAGLFNALTGGTMFSRVNLNGIPKTDATDELTVTWEVTAN